MIETITEDFRTIVEYAGIAIDALGVSVIVIGLVVAFVRFAGRSRDAMDRFRVLRQDLGRGILLGLEILIAADIIRTVAVTPTMRSVAVLGLIVVIRTFLSWALQVELERRWPWQQRPQDEAG